MNTPNKLTVLRMLMIPAFVLVLYLMEPSMSRYVAVAIFIVASFTDFLDGYIARKYNLVTNFGKFMDPLADKLLLSSALVMMVEIGDIPAWVAILIISRELLITGFRLIALESKIVLAAGYLGKIKTVFQMAMVIFILPQFDTLFNNNVGAIIANILIAASVILTVWSAVDYIYKNRKVLR